MNTRALVVISLGLLALGLLLGLIPGSASGAGGDSFNCGSPWVRDSEGARRQEHVNDLTDAMVGLPPSDGSYAARCDETLNARGIFGGVAAGLGVLALLGVAIVRRPEDQTPSAAPDNAAH